MKSFQEIPVDLFDHLIKTYNGVETKRNSSQFGIIKFTQGNLYVIHKHDYGFCHPSWPYTAISLYAYEPTIWDVIKEGVNTFNNENDERLKGKLYFTISSNRMDERSAYFNLLYKNHNPIPLGEKILQRDMDGLVDICKSWVENELKDEKYGFDNQSNETHNVQYWEEEIKLHSINPTMLQFFKELETNRDFATNWKEYQNKTNAVLQ